MIIIDAIIFMIIVGLLHYYKSKNPNFLFFCKGAMLFLPPDQQKFEEYQQLLKSQQKNKNKSKIQQAQPQHEIAILQIQYNHVKTYPFCTQYQRILMTIVALIIFYIFRALFSMVLTQISYLPFYILIAIITYTIKVSVDIFMVSAYRSMTVIIIALGLNVFYFILLLCLGNYEGVYDRTIDYVAEDYTKHLQIILGEQNSINFINKYTILFMVVFINFFITLATIPSIVKFGNWYSKTLKEIYYDDQEQNKRQSKIQAEKNVKQNSKLTISLLNYYLIATLAFIVCSHRIVIDYGVSEWLVDVLRLIFFCISALIIVWTVKDAIQFNGAFAYKHVIDYFQQKQQKNRLEIRKKIVPYIYHIWYHFHQFMIRIFIPILLLILVTHWKYFTLGHPIQLKTNLLQNHQDIGNLLHQNSNFDVQCSINTNELSLIKNLYKCPIKSYNQLTLEQKLKQKIIPSGLLISEKLEQSPAQLQEKLQKYGFLDKNFLAEVAEMILWYEGITVYGMTVIYVLFLRKTVYQI